MGLQKQKRSEFIKQQRNQIVELMKQDKEELARIKVQKLQNLESHLTKKVEHLLNEEGALNAFEILELLCDRLQSRLDLIEVSE